MYFSLQVKAFIAIHSLTAPQRLLSWKRVKR